MRGLTIVLALFALAACSSQPAPGVFTETPSPQGSPNPPAALDISALRAIRDEALSVLQGHVHDGHLDMTWGSGSPATAGPYHNDQVTVDSLGWLAGIGDLRNGALDGLRVLDNPQGAVYTLLVRAQGPADVRKQVADKLKADWYDTSSRSFQQSGAPSTVYRPVDAFAVGAAMLLESIARVEVPQPGQAQPPFLTAGTDIVSSEVRNDLDITYGLPYGLMTAAADGSRQATDQSSHPTDAAGIAELLLEAFDASREHQQVAAAQQVLQPLFEDKAGLFGSGGYAAAIDLKTGGVTPGVDLAAGPLVLEAAHHYDRDDGNRFARLEERAAAEVVRLRQNVDSGSGLVTALIVVALNDVIGAPAHIS